MLSYVAGFFDGEGSINISRRQRKSFSPEHSLTVAIGQRDGETLDWIQEHFGGNLHQVKRDGSYTWYCGNQKALAFLKELFPFLRYKKPQAQLAISFYEGGKRDRGRAIPADELERRERIREEMKMLHRTIVKSQRTGSTTERKDSES